MRIFEVEVVRDRDWELVSVRADSPQGAVREANGKAPAGKMFAPGCTVTELETGSEPCWEYDDLFLGGAE